MNAFSKIRGFFLIALIATASIGNAAELRQGPIKRAKDAIKPLLVVGAIGLLNSVYAAAMQVSELEEIRGDKCACVETIYGRILCAERPDCCDGRAADGPCWIISMEEMADLW